MGEKMKKPKPENPPAAHQKTNSNVNPTGRDPSKRFTNNELLTLILSTLALLVSGTTLYVQFFYVSESITAAKIHLEIARDQKSGPIALDIALINGGNRDTLIPGCTLESESVTFELERPTEAQMILKPYEIKPRTLKGTFTVNDDAPNGATPITLICEIVGAHGFDLKPPALIGSLIINGGKVTGHDLLHFPVELIEQSNSQWRKASR
jgi:hypothetical protein